MAWMRPTLLIRWMKIFLLLSGDDGDDVDDDVDYNNDDQSVDWVNDWLIDWWWWLCSVQVLSLKAQYCILGEFVKGNWRIWERVGVIQFSLSVINVFSFRITFRINVLVCTCVLSGAGHLFLLLYRIIVTTLKKLLPGELQKMGKN